MSIELRLYIEPLDQAILPRRQRVTILRGQLTLIRMRIEQGIPLSVESIKRAEQIARTLELCEVSV